MKHLKKYQTLGLTALTAGTLLLPLPAMAAENGAFTVYQGNVGKCSYKIIIAGKNCNLPDINLPEAPETVLPEAPETSLPEMPENGQPDNEIQVPEEDLTSHAYISRIVELVNAERAKEGLAPLTLAADMTNAAMVRAREIQTSFSHTRPNGSSFSTALREAGVSYNRAGENIAWGQRSPEEVVTAWMNSSGHRANIMNAGFSRIGVGYLTNASGTPYWVQLFAN
ncbi:MAG: CAP domain-containing protein [Lachnospiraceae bacterium]